MRKQYGLSLVELLISITLGLILIAGVTQMLLGTKLTFNSQKALSRVQENGRLAIEFMSKDIRMAGYIGCTSRTGLIGAVLDSTLNNSSNFENDFLTGVQGYTISSITDPDYTMLSAAGIGIAPKVGTDVIALSGAVGTGSVVETNNDADNVFADFANTVTDGCGAGKDSYDGMCGGDVLAVTNCVQGRIFQATDINNPSGVILHAGSGTPGNAIASWAATDPVFGPGSEITRMEKKVYYVKDNGAGEPGLWLWVNGVSSELIEGVENIAITYGRDTTAPKDDVPDVYEDASTIDAANAWDRVLSVRVELLVRTPEATLNEDQSISFPMGSTVTKYTDRRLRQVFTSTVGVRSRLQ